MSAPELPWRFCQRHHLAAGSRAEIKMLYCHMAERSVGTPGPVGLGGFLGLRIAFLSQIGLNSVLGGKGAAPQLLTAEPLSAGSK